MNIINTTKLRCHEDINGTLRVIENCRACVVFINSEMGTTMSSRKMILHDQSSIKELSLSDGKNRRRRRNTDTIIYQKCSRESDGPLYGYNRTHCYCNSNLCNSNVQRCIYEIISKPYFSCFHDSKFSDYVLEINKKCRSCRIRIDTHLKYHYECLTFGEQEQKNHTHCTCQYPMCNQDFAMCQRTQLVPTQSRVNLVHGSVLNAIKNTPINTTAITTTTITTTTSTATVTVTAINTVTASLIINLTQVLTTLLSLNQTEVSIFVENSTLNELISPSCNETSETETVAVGFKNHANYLSLNLFYVASIVLFMYKM